jgi:NAD(P)-dependent dehydrogenase (short-subunit alcohol dehydrogenase family)
MAWELLKRTVGVDMSPWVSRTIKISAALMAAKAVMRRARRIDFVNRTVVISGGSRGLGLELARRFAAEGARLALLARSSEELQKAGEELEKKGAGVLLLPCDVRNENDIDQSVQRVIDWSGRIDVLINNAGVIQVGPYEHMEREDYENALQVHFWGPLQLMLRAIPHMKRRGEGRIVNIASFGGKVAVPHLVPYCASKFALVGLSDAMRSELAKYRIGVTTVCPGLMRTGSHVNAWFKGQHEKEFALFSIANALPLLSVSAPAAAARITNACRYGDAFVTIGPQARLAEVVNAVFPDTAGELLKVIARLLPGEGSSQAKLGWESRSGLAPGWLTYLSDAAIEQNNETLPPGRRSVTR